MHSVRTVFVARLTSPGHEPRTVAPLHMSPLHRLPTPAASDAPTTCRRSGSFCVAHTRPPAQSSGTRLPCMMYSLKAYPDGRTCMYVYIYFSPDGLGCKSISLAEGSPWEWSGVPRISINTGAPPGIAGTQLSVARASTSRLSTHCSGTTGLTSSDNPKFIRHFLFVSLSLSLVSPISHFPPI